MEAALQIVSWVLICAGSFFCVVGGIGVVRLPDFYARLHAAGVTDTMGAWLILVGLMCQVEVDLATVSRLEITAKLGFIMFFLFVTSPVASHALAQAAWSRGLEPKLHEGDGDG